MTTYTLSLYGVGITGSYGTGGFVVIIGTILRLVGSGTPGIVFAGGIVVGITGSYGTGGFVVIIGTMLGPVGSGTPV